MALILFQRKGKKKKKLSKIAGTAMRSEFLLNGEAQEAFPWSQEQDEDIRYFHYCLILC